MPKTLLLAFTLVAITSTANLVSAATKAPLFARGAEVFKIQDNKGHTPQFRILDDTTTEKALALAAITFINSHEEVTPKVPVRDYIDLKVESLKLIPKSKSELEMTLKLSGYNLQMNRTVDRKKFLSGQPIHLRYDPTEKEIALFNVQSRGNMKMQLDPKTNTIALQEVFAKLDYESQFGATGSEEIKFNGRGIRQ